MLDGGSSKKLWGVSADENAGGQTFESAEQIQKHLGSHRLTAELLWNRGFRSAASLDLFLKPELSKLPDPFSIIDLQKAAERVAEAVANEEPIAIYGDYDVDGTCGLSILVDFFRSIGVNVTAYQPNRFTEGYGVHVSSLEKLFDASQDNPEGPIRVLISVDCGITAVAPAAFCKERGVDYIVLDHHKLGATLPDAYAVVDPLRPEDESGLTNLCGAGIAFFFAMGLRSILRAEGFFNDDERPEPNLARLLDLVAIATVADVVDVRGVNRILLTHGLRQMNAAKLGRPIRTGLQAMFEASGIALDKAPTTRQCGFVIGPRINAAGRLKSARAAFELLTTTDLDAAREMARSLEEVNASRREVQDEVAKQAREQALAQLSDPRWEELKKEIPAAALGPWPRTLVLAPADGPGEAGKSNAWHEGVVGIVASKIVEEFHRPVFVLTQKETAPEEAPQLKGSVRSIKKIDILAAISAESVAKELTNFGGHAHAGGVTLLRENLQKFREAINHQLAITSTAPDYERQIHFDVEATLEQISPKLVQEFETLEPFGQRFESPVLKICAVYPKDVRVLKEKHLKFRLPSGIDAVWFNAKSLERFTVAGEAGRFRECALWVSPEWNEWQGVRKVQLMVKHADTDATIPI